MLTVIRLGWEEKGDTKRITYILNRALKNVEYETFCGTDEFVRALENKRWHGDRILFAVNLSSSGLSLDCTRMISYLIENQSALSGVTGGLIVDGKGELFTKSQARQLVFAANMAGCTFPGKSLVEATGNLYNFNVLSKVKNIGHYEAYAQACEELVQKVLDFQEPKIEHPNILAVHASNSATSNTVLLWEMVKRGIWNRADIMEVPLRNGSVIDCSGCSYNTCVHFGEKGSCLYGGIIVEKVYPAILACDDLVLLCPNYNDAVSANITAFINRLTALFRTNDFSKKRVFALVVSGYSGGDIVTEQIIGAMCFNKNFILPGKFALVETANDPGSILESVRIEQRAAALAERICG